MDAATYKDCIFGMLFLKRCSAVFRGEWDVIVDRKVAAGLAQEEAESQYGENPDYYDTFYVPERARWRYLQDKLMHREAGELERFDRVIANPPFSQNYSRTNMEFPERFRWGWCPTTGKKGDLMFAQHMLAGETGPLVVPPSGGLNRLKPAQQTPRLGETGLRGHQRIATSHRPSPIAPRFGR